MASKRTLKDDTQLELFTLGPVAGDVRSKQVRDLMSWGVFNIGNRAKKSIRHEEGDLWLEVSAQQGSTIANYFDNDLMIFLVSFLVHAQNEGEDIGPRIQFSAHDFFRFANRQHASGARYEQIWNSLIRLQDTFVHTNIDIGNGDILESRWNWLPSIHRLKSRHSDKSIGFEVRIADAIFRSIKQDNPRVLTLHQDYFKIRSGFLKWLYLYARKHCGTDGREWIATEKDLWLRSGSAMRLSDFRQLLVSAVNVGSICEYEMKHCLVGISRAIVFRRNRLALLKQHKTTLIME